MAQNKKEGLTISPMVECVNELKKQRKKLGAALRGCIRWVDDGPCWCDCRRKAAAENGTKIHSNACRNARAALAEFDRDL